MPGFYQAPFPFIRANPFDNQTQKVSLVVMHHRKTGTVLLDVFESAGGK
jgi:hypothetical protein